MKNDTPEHRSSGRPARPGFWPGFQSGLALLGWGMAYLISPPDFAALAWHGSPLVWAVVPALCGAAQLAVVWGGRPHEGRAASLLATGVWGTIELFLYLTHCRVVMLFIIPTFGVTNILSFILAAPHSFDPEGRDDRLDSPASPSGGPTTPESAPVIAMPIRRVVGDKDHAHPKSA